MSNSAWTQRVTVLDWLCDGSTDKDGTGVYIVLRSNGDPYYVGSGRMRGRVRSFVRNLLGGSGSVLPDGLERLTGLCTAGDIRRWTGKLSKVDHPIAYVPDRADFKYVDHTLDSFIGSSSSPSQPWQEVATSLLGTLKIQTCSMDSIDDARRVEGFLIHNFMQDHLLANASIPGGQRDEGHRVAVEEEFCDIISKHGVR